MKPMELYKKTFIAVFALCCLSNSRVSAQGTLLWQKTYGGTGDDYVWSSMPTLDGGIIVSGETTSNDVDVVGNHGTMDMWVVKLDDTGGISWKKTLGGNLNDRPYSAFPTIDGGQMVFGYTSSHNNGDVSGYKGGPADFWMIKLNSTGNIAWQKCFGGSSDDYGYTITPCLGGYVIAGTSNSQDSDVVAPNAGVGNLWIAKVNDTGKILWEKCYGGSGAEYAQRVQPTPDKGFIVLANTNSNDGDVLSNHGAFDIWILKLDSAGTLQWQKTYGGSQEERGYSLLQTFDGNYLVTGMTTSSNGDVTGFKGDRDAWLLKISNTGSLIWAKTYGGSSKESITGAVQTPDSAYILVGGSNSNDGDLTVNKGAFDVWIYKVDPAGSILWQQVYGGTGNDGAVSIHLVNKGYVDGAFAGGAGGDVPSYRGGMADYWIMKFYDSTIKLGVKGPSLANNVKVYPTLSKGIIHVTLPAGYENVQIAVLNSLGQSIKYTESGTPANRQINLGDAPAGMYLLKIAGNNDAANYKILLQH